jgi:hypothetical protein
MTNQLSSAARLEKEKFWTEVRKNEAAFVSKTFTIRARKKQIEFVYNRPQMYLERLQNRLEAEGKPVRLAILKYRQWGCSTYFGAKGATRLLSSRNFRGAVVAHVKNRSKTLFRLYRKFINKVDPRLRPLFDTSNQEELYSEELDSSATIATAKTPDAIRGDTMSWLHLSECDYYLGEGGSLKVLLTACLPLVPYEAGTTIVLETTANTTAGEYYEFYNLAREGRNGFLAVFIFWANDPVCDKAFHRHPNEDKYSWEEIKAYRDSCDECARCRKDWFKHYCPDHLKERAIKYKLTPEQVHWYWHHCQVTFGGDYERMCQEYPCSWKEAFVAAGRPIWPKKTLEKLETFLSDGVLYDPPKKKFVSLDQLTPNENLERGKDVYFEVYEPAIRGHRYALAGDTSAGEEASNPGALLVVDLDDYNAVVAVLHGRVPPEELADYIEFVATYYNFAIAAPERNNTGYAVLAPLTKNYPNIFQQHRLKAGFWDQTSNLGWSTDQATRPYMVSLGRRVLSAYSQDIETLAKLIRSKHLLQQMFTFTHDHLNRGKAAAKVGAEDDLVMAWLIALCVAHVESGMGISEDVTGIRSPSAAEREAFSKPPANFKEYSKQLDEILAGTHKSWEYAANDLEDE